jgi:polyphosphate kinase 2
MPPAVPSTLSTIASVPAKTGSADTVRVAKLLRELSGSSEQKVIEEAAYHQILFQLQCELVKLQDWVFRCKRKLVVIFEGRDAAGKGGMIKRITQRLNPRHFRVAALLPPTEREKSQWYFQRYIAHLPSGGEIVFFDRSWYNRAGVERVMGFCLEDEYQDFLASVPQFESMIANSGIMLIKYWFSITYEEQLRRLKERACHPLKQWKLSPNDIESLYRWNDYTRAKETMLRSTHTPDAPWWIVDAVDKRRARLNCIHHLLDQVPYGFPRQPQNRNSGPEAHPIPQIY